MSTTSTITVVSNDDVVTALRSDTASPSETAVRVAKYMNKLALSCGNATIAVQVNGGTAVAASGTLTLSSVVANDTCVVGTETFTAKASPSGNNQFLVGVSDTATAVNLAATINAHPSLVNVVVASPAAAVVTVTAANKGLAGNMIALVGSTDIVASVANLSGGLEPSNQVCHLGL